MQRNEQEFMHVNKELFSEKRSWAFIRAGAFKAKAIIYLISFLHIYIK